MSLWTWMHDQFVGSSASVSTLDHLPIGGQKLPAPTATLEKPKADLPPPNYDVKRREAIERARRAGFTAPLATEAPATRITPPSRDLEHIKALTEEAKRAARPRLASTTKG